ncbi:NUDIX hydrolase [Halegenticoccus tardaugens]|uniref:NUDIX hydrolase n=1 Tax=Halegenticoccus tardaugens TaxID=2071624 RepID=UPI00100A32A6|nr:NUDIX domain-containing protein [Halegenticoccus tardaugens]
MTTLDDLWFLADEASQCAEQAYHALKSKYAGFMERPRTRRVSRRRFRTLANRVKATGAPYGAHTIVYRPSGELLLVRHEGVDKWVLPGGGIAEGEAFREAAARELREEAGIAAEYEGLAMANRVDIECDDYRTWGVLPVFVARPSSTDLSVDDPDGEISDARWFAELPPDTRDREDLLAWRARRSF